MDKNEIWQFVWIILTGLYIVMPFDAIPDFIPLIGFLDDFAAIALAINKVTQSKK